MTRKDQLKKDFQNILNSWKKALDLPETEISRDAAILRFELTFEVGWKLMQILAKDEGYEINSPRQAFQHAFSMGWVNDEIFGWIF